MASHRKSPSWNIAYLASLSSLTAYILVFPCSRWGGWGGWGGPDIVETEARPRTMGILAVDLIDVKKKEMIWRGQATVDMVSNTQKGDEKQVQKSVEKMFKQYPPKEK